MSRGIRVGLTGGIGSGKTFVSGIFQLFRIPIYHSDIEAKRLMDEDENLRTGLENLFGPKVYTKGKINKEFLASVIFNNPAKRTQVNHLVHPVVRNDFNLWVQKQILAPYVINEAALFVENGSYKDFDYLISVISPMELRKERTINSRPITEKSFYSRVQAQSTDKQKADLSDFKIYNDYTQSILQQCVKIHKTILHSLMETETKKS